MPVQAFESKKWDKVAYNCYLYVKSKIPSFPNTKNLVPNSFVPVEGGVVILKYGGVIHYAVTPIESTPDGVLVDESNFKKGKYTQRFLTWEYLKEKKAQYWKP